MIYTKNDTINVLLLPSASDITPLGVSIINIVISRTEYRIPISRKLIPFAKKKSMRNASKNRRFLKKPYRQNL